jgi:NADH-quinone oxidoreductase subunit N
VSLLRFRAPLSLFKLLNVMNADLSASFQIIVVIISMASMTVGNIMALRQVNVKRMLAYSGISHAGFMLMTLLSVSNAGSLLYYTSAYALTGIAAFSVILYVCKDSENEDNKFPWIRTNPLCSYSNCIFIVYGDPYFRLRIFLKWFYSIKRFRLVILL